MTTDKKREDPYFVEVERNGCDKCGHGRQYAVVCPDGSMLGVTFDDEDDAADLADHMNAAYWAGRGDTEAEIERVKAAFWREHQCGVPNATQS